MSRNVHARNCAQRFHGASECTCHVANAHTPGPWVQDDTGLATHNNPLPADWVAVGLTDADGFAEIVACVHPINAPIVSAAPELLAALEEAHELMPLDGTKKRADWVIRTCAVLAKARGEAL